MEDKQLERLYDYTKFHIGIYLSAAAGLTTLITAAASKDFKREFFQKSIGQHWALALALVLMVAAGAAGGVIATATIDSKTYDEFKSNYHGAFGFKLFNGTTWVIIEHRCFWLSLVFMAVVIFSAPGVLCWIFNSKT